MRIKTIKQAINKRLCIGCGLCELKDGVKMEYSKGILLPNRNPHDFIVENSCPAKGYNLKKLASELFGEVDFRYEIGYYRTIKIAHTSDKLLMEKAASGGVMAQISLALLNKKLIDGVISNKFIVEKGNVRTETFIAKTKDEIIAGQGSKYCPTSTLSILKELEPNKKYLLIGTPCQIAGFRLYASYNKQVKDQILFTIANFCGGYRDFREIDFFVHDVAHISDVIFFRHRGGGQPGCMRIDGNNGEIFQYPYPKYARISPFVKNERCSLCMDATGELADFSCGDAWLENRDKSTPWSIIIARSEPAERILQEIVSEGLMVEGESITPEQVIESQNSNITSKKYRQYKRIKVRDALLMFSPLWECDFPVVKGSYWGEIKIMLSKFKSQLLNNR